jgi:hypothetical protein
VFSVDGNAGGKTGPESKNKNTPDFLNAVQVQCFGFVSAPCAVVSSIVSANRVAL